MQLKANINTAGAATITLGGEKFFVPVLALRQCRVVVPALNAILPQLAQIIAQPSLLTATLFDALADIIFMALDRAYEVTREEVLDLPVSVPEIGPALLTIGAQTGLLKAAAPGEDQGAKDEKEPPTPPTSTESSADIANIPANHGPTP